MSSPTPAERSQGSPRTLSVRGYWGRWLAFVTLTAAGTSADLYSKRAVFEQWGFPGGESRLFLDSWVKLRFHTSFNHGALWGIGQHFTGLFSLLSVLAVGIILYWLFVRGAARSWTLTLCLALILAGTLGNLYDRLGLHGLKDPITGKTITAVRDFLLFQFGTFDWPVFNLADVFLVTGALCLIAQSVWGDVSKEPAN